MIDKHLISLPPCQNIHAGRLLLASGVAFWSRACRVGRDMDDMVYSICYNVWWYLDVPINLPTLSRMHRA